MYDGDGVGVGVGDRALSSSSSSSPPPPPADPELTMYPPWYVPAPSEDADHKENGYLAYNYGYSSLSDSDEDESYRYPGYSRPAAGEDEEAYHYYTAASDWDDEDTYNGYPALSDCEEDQPLQFKEDQLPRYPHAPLEPEDALSGIYDVAVLLKDQHYHETRVTQKLFAAPSTQFQHETVSQMPALPHFQVSSVGK
ncbi:hypothetical protein GOP47_0029199 [Adiantum capillus-veneris]|nr:hypothetical protein GOP47_0029199 [Adiantum capillus-veneris]